MTRRGSTSGLMGGLLSAIAPVAFWAGAGGAAIGGSGGFLFPTPGSPILSASFRGDFAGFNAQREIAGVQVNMLMLMDSIYGMADLSDEFFGVAGGPARIDQGVTETGIFEAMIPTSYLVALEDGEIGMWGSFTDTYDGEFAIDFWSLSITTTTETFEVFYGDGNDGFNLGIADGESLPGAPSSVLTPTGTGFDEAISFKAVHMPLPGAGALGAAGLAMAWARRGRRADGERGVRW